MFHKYVNTVRATSRTEHSVTYRVKPNIKPKTKYAVQNNAAAIKPIIKYKPTFNPCFMGVISFVQLKFGNLSPKNIPINAIKITNKVMKIKERIISVISYPKTIIAHVRQKYDGISVSSICRDIFALSTIHGLIGKDCSIHKFLPSSETEGATVSFITDIVHTAVITITGINPLITGMLSNWLIILLLPFGRG